MDRDTVATEIVEFIESEFPNPGQTLTATTDLLSDWFLDSLGVVETVLFLETRFGTRLARADLNGENFQTAETIAGLVLSRQED